MGYSPWGCKESDMAERLTLGKMMIYTCNTDDYKQNSTDALTIHNRNGITLVLFHKVGIRLS